MINKLFNTATELYRSGLYNESIEYLDRIIDSEDDFLVYDAFLGKATCLFFLEKYDKALEYFNRISYKHKLYSTILYPKGVSLVHCKRYKEALEYFNQIIDQDDINLIMCRYYCLLELNELDTAMQLREYLMSKLEKRDKNEEIPLNVKILDLIKEKEAIWWKSSYN